ncbi:MAG: SMC-Scp complex subunit ScpB [Pseudomonadota bacterium]|jgi:segregation and condensation protein B|uniref:SMC-Scp complex subunit ScpB n=1 Tax=Psychrobacter sp. UBA2514 TaxID=1947346 RepID=UPI00257B1241|nr:SMC-Scp complex subunit ScpB [Psychrobacter sp. UBA2514]MEC9444341.1 SMC-Scp complex subunit ScpB [Pseudomonadota bacterium]MED6316660.1 SMC-Scp complex subunit ScpB [Pseudomonadota bacterium]|tara:strand:- start:3836 stop:4447 length:612 start_codon:yes stop_codon:yes gene_type:complete
MVDIDDPKQHDEAKPTRAAATASIEEDHTSLEDVSKHIEVLLHASEAPLTAHALRKHLSLSTKELKQALEVLERRLETGVLNLHETASGYRLQISDAYSGLIQQTFPQRQERLSQALLETLSVIAYKQPVTRSDIEQVRGVTLSSNILRQLFDKGWIIEKGFKETLGRPALLHTTAQFLDAFGLSHLDELPPMPDMDSIRAMS